MSLSCLPAELLLYMVFRRLEYNSEVFAVSALGHIGAEHVKEYFIHACWGSSKLTFNTCWDF
jgi:hypothetical protein